MQSLRPFDSPSLYEIKQRQKGNNTPASPLVRTAKIVFCIILSAFVLSAPGSSANAASADAQFTTYTTPILALWRDANASLVVQTGYGEFYYTYDATVHTKDGKASLRLSDPGAALLKAILTRADGRPVTLRVSTRVDNLLLGLDDVVASLAPVGTPSPEKAP